MSYFSSSVQVDNTEMVRMSFEHRLDLEKAHEIYEKNLRFLNYEHLPNSPIISLRLPPKLSEVLSIHSGGDKTSVGCEQYGVLQHGQRKYPYNINYSYMGQYGNVRIRFIERIPEMDEKDLFNSVYDCIQPHLKFRAFKYLCMCLPNPPNPSQYPCPCDVPEFHTEYCQQILLKRGPVPQAMRFRDCEMFIDTQQAIYIIECFALNQSKREIGLTEKDFFLEKKVYNLMMFAELPVLFQKSGMRVKVSFANYCEIPAQKIAEQFRFILQLFFHSRQMICQFYEVLNYNFKQAHVIDAENTVGTAIVKDMDQPTFPNKNRNFMLYSLTSEPGEQQFQLYQSTLREAWNKICVYICPVCRQKNTSRNPCPLGVHVGERIPFEDGSMEKETYIGGFKTKQYKYTCCGVVNEICDEGCSTATNHTFPTDDSYFLSDLFFKFI